MIADLLDSNLATGLVGVAGVLIGLFADRMLQRQGKVRCEMDPIELHSTPGDEKGRSYTVYRLPVRADKLPDPHATGDSYGEPEVRCNINVRLFNEKEVKTGLRDVVLAFDGSPPLEKILWDKTTWRPPPQLKQMDQLEVVNLPSREWVALSLTASIPPEEAGVLAKCDRAWLRGYFPDGRKFDARVPFKPRPMSG